MISTEDFTDGALEDKKADGNEPEYQGDLLKLPAEEAARLALKLWKSQDKIMARRLAQWRANEMRREGHPNVQVVKSQDLNQYKAWIPPGQSPDAASVVNRAASNCRKLVSLLFADPPRPEPEPGTDGEQVDEDAREFAERVLIDLDSEASLDDLSKAREAVDTMCTFGSGFIWYYIDGEGGGEWPVQIDAHPQAPHADVATIDPMTQQPTDELVKRHVAPDGSLVDDPQQAEKKPVAILCSEVLTGRNVRFIPHTADIRNAIGVQIAWFKAWGELRATFKQLAEVGDDAKKAILDYRPEKLDDLLPRGESKANMRTENEDEQLVFGLTTYYRNHPSYPDGAYVVTIANKLRLVAEPWAVEVNGKKEHLLLPLAQYAGLREGREDPYRVAPMEIMGPANETRAALFGAALDHLEKFSQRKTFVPVSSIVNPADLQLPNRTVIPINPGGKPEYEELPDMPRDLMAMFEQATREADNSIGLNETAQGLQDPNVTSGRQAYAMIGQVHAQLSEYKQNIERAYTRGGRIKLQLVSAYYDTPRQIKWTGEDGRYRQKAWTGADIGSTRDVRIKSGSMTMLASASKQQLANDLLASRAIDLDEYKEMVSTNLSPIIALQENPFLKRVRQQISDWAEGPPEGWMPQPPVPQPVMDPMGQPALQDDGMGNVQPALQMVQPPDPVLSQIWMPVPSDTMPNVSAVRLRELAKLTATARYTKHPPEWRKAVDDEFARMAGVIQQAQAVQQQPGAVEEQKESPDQQAVRSANQKQGLAA